MKTLLTIIILLSLFGFCGPKPSPLRCFDCDPVPEATPTPTPTPTPQFTCFYVIVDGVKRQVCE